MGLGKLIRVVACLALLLGTRAFAADGPPAAADKPLRAGIIGLDTSHAIAFTKIFTNPKATGDIANVKIVAAYPGGSQDIASSRDRVEQYTQEIKAMGVEIVDSIPKLLEKVDVVLLESVDGRPHLEQARAVLEAGKPIFIDKPLAGSLADGIAIAELAKKRNAPWFSASSLRFGPTIEAVKKDPKVGDIVGADAWSPSPLEPTHPDFFWYGIHGVEMLYTLMGPGCESVVRMNSKGTDVVVGKWKDGRLGTFRGIRDGKATYGGTAFGAKGVAPAGTYEGYEPLVAQIATFFKTHKPPVQAEETIEILAFMEAADESKRQNGAPVTIESVMAKAKAEAAKKMGK